MKRPIFHPSHLRAFSLVEVVLALAVCTFVLVALVGLLGTGLQTSRDSEGQIHAADVASLLASVRTASPTNTIPYFAIPASAMTNLYGNVYPDGAGYIGYDGKLTNAASAAYQITCWAGTNGTTGGKISQLYLMLTWPAQVSAGNASTKHYELLTYVSLH